MDQKEINENEEMKPLIDTTTSSKTEELMEKTIINKEETIQTEEGEIRPVSDEEVEVAVRTINPDANSMESRG